MNYLLMPEAKSELKAVVRAHVVDEVIYMEDLEGAKGRREVETLQGAKVEVGWEASPTMGGTSGRIDTRIDSGRRVRPSAGSITSISGDNDNATNHLNGTIVIGSVRRPLDGEKANGELRDGRVELGDMLTSTGVVHQIDQVLLPPSLNITIAKVLKGARSTSIMTDLLVRSNLTWLLHGAEPTAEDLAPLGLAGWHLPSSDPDASESSSSLKHRPIYPTSFTLLCPLDSAFSTLNITHYLSSPPLLLSLLAQHIIPSYRPAPLPENLKAASITPLTPLPYPSDGRPLRLEPDVAYATLLSASSKFGDLAFSRDEDAETGRAGTQSGWKGGESDDDRDGNEGIGYVVGIKGAKGTEDGMNDWARVLGFGRASPHWPSSSSASSLSSISSSPITTPLLLNGVTRGGGVLLIDTVLVPFKPTWFMLWGWTVLLSLLGIIAGISLAAIIGVWCWQRRERVGADYEVGFFFFLSFFFSSFLFFFFLVAETNELTLYCLPFLFSSSFLRRLSTFHDSLLPISQLASPSPFHLAIEHAHASCGIASLSTTKRINGGTAWTVNSVRREKGKGRERGRKKKRAQKGCGQVHSKYGWVGGVRP